MYFSWCLLFDQSQTWHSHTGRPIPIPLLFWWCEGWLSSTWEHVVKDASTTSKCWAAYSWNNLSSGIYYSCIFLRPCKFVFHYLFMLIDYICRRTTWCFFPNAQGPNFDPSYHDCKICYSWHNQVTTKFTCTKEAYSIRNGTEVHRGIFFTGNIFFTMQANTLSILCIMPFFHTNWNGFFIN